MPPVDKSAIPVMRDTLLSLVNVTAVNTTLGCAVLDYVPRNQVFPYIRLEGFQEINDGAMGQPGKTAFAECHVFTSEESDLGSDKVSKIVSKIRELTYFPTIAPTADFVCKGLWTEDVMDAGDEVDDDGKKLSHWIVRVRAWWMPAS